jgi:hypothetical protein
MLLAPLQVALHATFEGEEGLPADETPLAKGRPRKATEPTKKAGKRKSEAKE